MGNELARGLVVASRYRLSHRLGEGGMGTVWAASCLDSDDVVALKLVKGAAGSEEDHRRLEREARAATTIAHPGIVRVVDVADHDGAPVLVMELLQGESLGAWLARDEHHTVEEVAGLMLQVVSAVGAAHSVGVVHRDLKPENIFLCGRDGGCEAKVLDFGIAKQTSLEAATTAMLATAGVTRTGALLGTPAYMAPEVVFGEKDVDHRADVWALGLLLYQCLSGFLPTRADNVGQVLKIIVSRPIAPLGELCPDLPVPLTDLADRMLSKDRARRPADLRRVAEVLARFAPGVQVPGFGAPASSLLVSSPPEQEEEAEEVPTASPPARRWLPWAVAACVLTLAVPVVLHRIAPPEVGAAAPATSPARPAVVDQGADRPSPPPSVEEVVEATDPGPPIEARTAAPAPVRHGAPPNARPPGDPPPRTRAVERSVVDPELLLDRRN